MKTRIPLLTLLLGILTALSSSAVLAQGQPGYPDHFYIVTPQIVRSARPESEQQLALLKKAGLKSIINLENDRAAVAREAQWAKNVGLNFYSRPMNAMRAVNTQEVDNILQLLTTSSNAVTLVHCHEGKDRTGLIIGLYRALVQHWKPADAYQEMIQLGFTRDLTYLDSYFKYRTGWNGWIEMFNPPASSEVERALVE